MNQNPTDWRRRIAVSPCSTPDLTLTQCLTEFSQLGYPKFEAFSTWVSSSVDRSHPPEFYLEEARQYGMEFSSFHLPPVGAELEATLQNSIEHAHIGAQIGAPVVLFKARQRELYLQSARRFLDATQQLPITPVLQNHFGSPISTLEDYREILAAIDDPRLKTLFEVGHFHMAGVSWQQGYQLLAPTLALVHLKDMRDGKVVPFGTGEIDLEGLLQHLQREGYRGDFVVEMEVEDRENVMQYLGTAWTWLQDRKELLA